MTRSRTAGHDPLAGADPHDLAAEAGAGDDARAVAPDRARAAVHAARTAFAGWRRSGPDARRDALRAMADAIERHRDELVELERSDTGRNRSDALGGLAAGVDTLRQLAELAPLRQGRSLRGSPEALDLTLREPRGVVAVITPWNDPVAITAGLVGAAVAVGDVVVHKPSERCPRLGRRLGRIMSEALPRDVLVVVDGDAETGAAIVADPDVDVVAHVGSSEAGERIARAAAATGAHVVRENGGNDALIVDAGVDPVWAAAQAALGAYANSGQICTSVERVLVHERVAREFVAALCDEARRLERTRALAPLVDERQRDAVDEQVRASIAMGARALVGGSVPPGAGSRYPATVLVDCTPGMPVFRRETFGPVAPVMVVADFDEALRRAADDEYGLAATVLTVDPAHAHRAIDELPVGTVKVNDVFGGAPGGSAQPRGRSGAGFGYGPDLLDELTRVKVVHERAGVPR